MKLVDKLRLSWVDRWQTVSVTRRQSVAEHSFNVAIIAGEIAGHLDTIPRTTVMAAALEHDLEEGILGDITTPAKQRLREAGLNYNKAKAKLSPQTILIDESIQAVIKAADYLDCMIFYQEYGDGRHQMQRMKAILSQFASWLERQHPALQDATETVMNKLMEDDITI